MSSIAASSVHQTETVLFLTLLQLIIIILAARGMNLLARRLGQPGAVGEIIAGLLLGPSLFGHLFPEFSRMLFAGSSALPLTVISQIGLILLMFQIGADFELGHLRERRNRRAVLFIGTATIVTPLILGILAGWISAPILAPDKDILAYSLFVGVALAITAVPILGRIMREFDLTNTPVGAVTIAAAAANDVVGWVLLAGISAYVGAQFSLAHAGLQVLGIAVLLGLALFVGRPLAAWLLRRFPIVDGTLPSSLMAVILALIFAAAMSTYLLGIFAIFGGFVMGTLFFDKQAFVQAWQRHVGQFVLVFFLPVFFTFTGLRTNIGGLDTATQWLWLALLLAAAMLGKIVPAYLAGRACGLDHKQSSMVGVLMNTRALMELIVLNVGYELGVIPPSVFTMLVIVAVVTTLTTAPLLRLCLAEPGRKVVLQPEG